jgi:hypothetical protein
MGRKAMIESRSDVARGGDHHDRPEIRSGVAASDTSCMCGPRSRRPADRQLFSFFRATEAGDLVRACERVDRQASRPGPWGPGVSGSAPAGVRTTCASCDRVAFISQPRSSFIDQEYKLI